MNKILVNNNIMKLQDETLFLKKEVQNIEVSGQSKIIVLNSDIINLKIKVNEKSSVIIEDFRLPNNDTNLEFITDKESFITYNHSFICNNKYNLNISTKYQAVESSITINVHGVNDGGQSNININGDLGNNNSNYLLENIRIINLQDGSSTVIPNMYVNSSNIIANHNVTIGKINKEELNYLMSKGINENSAKQLILNGFLINIFNTKENITKIKELINWR